MTKEMAIVLLGRKDVYLTSEGKKVLQDILKSKEGTKVYVPANC
ncbi:hypothetical protein [Bacillus sp. FJAT-47783]|nr:hypothetical protein [Bacillus sp. FJAT-47783]